ncbi:DUF2235 domain-containing protein, partial [bacterium]|nr:DUF2235 domain-containing protein [bacterium]
TVDALGFPDDRVAEFVNRVLYRFKFPNYSLLDEKGRHRVDRACQALAVDDERATFHPLLWNESEDTGSWLTQVWFSGAHTNVGGGFPKHGMSLAALDWMMGEAEAAELRFIPEVRATYHDSRNANDKLADSRGGAAYFYRYKPRNIWDICDKHDAKPAIHVSALERIAQQIEGYAPGNVPCSSTIAETRGGPAADHVADLGEDVETFLTERLGEWTLAAGLRRRFPKWGGGSRPPQSLLDLEGWVAQVRSVAHYFFLAAALGLCVLAALTLKKVTGDFLPTSGERLLVLWEVFCRGICSGAWAALLAVALLLVIIATLVIAVWTRWRMERDFSEFWYSALPGMRRMMVDRLRPGAAKTRP